INIFVFAALNYGMYYVLQTVIGKKFLEDFCQISTMKAALVLSVMSGLYAIAGPCIAAMSRAALNRRAAFMKFSALNTFFIFLAVLICLLTNYKTSILALALCMISFWASLSPLLIPLLHDTNESKEASVAVGMMTSGFYFVVGILGNLTGWILNIYTPEVKEGAAIVYSNSAYSVIFLCLVILSLVSLKTAFSIKESLQTRRYIKMCGLIMRHKTHGDEIYSGSGH
ncbi:MAG: hypothetical protein LUE64_06770, partial [Candidatus Gastranaerophilales bacterium]|nr:hypothetical protein [Candidatus Gastranaerophilales bacterium]